MIMPNADYKEFLAELDQILSGVESTLDSDDRRRAALALWTVGKKVYEYSQEEGLTVKQVADDLGVPAGTMQKYVQVHNFHRVMIILHF